MREITSVDDLDRGLVVRWEWPKTEFYKDIKYRPIGIVVTRVENPFGLFKGKYHIRLLDCAWWEFPPEEVFKRGRKLYA